MQGLVTEIIGQADDQGIDVLEVLASMDIVSEFPKEVLDQAEAVPEEVPENEIVGRVDYRNEITFTIVMEQTQKTLMMLCMLNVWKMETMN